MQQQDADAGRVLAFRAVMIGVTSINVHQPNYLNELKRDILFFDSIAICNVKNAVERWYNSSNTELKHSANNLEFLMESDFFTEKYANLNDYTESSIVSKINNNPKKKKLILSELMAFTKVGLELNHSMRSHSQSLEAISSEIHKLESESALKTAEEFNSAIRDLENDLKLKDEINKHHHSTITNFNSRAIASIMKLVINVETTTIQNNISTHSHASLPHSYKESLSKSDIIEMAISRVPMPSELTPWETIFEMLQDEDLRNRARKLRIWATDISKKKYTPNELKDILEEQVYEYERSMYLHTKKTKRGILKSIIVSSGELTESLMKLKLGKIAKDIVSINEKHIDLLQLEAKAPGRAVSIIPILTKKFDD